MADVRFFVFDCETVADGDLVSRLRHGGRIPGHEAIAKYRQEQFWIRGCSQDFLDLIGYGNPFSTETGK